jgi:hypothetical protein
LQYHWLRRITWLSRCRQDAFGDEITYGQIIKEFAEPVQPSRYGPPMMVVSERRQITGLTNMDLKKISTSHVERNNLNIRHFIKRFTRLTASVRSWKTSPPPLRCVLQLLPRSQLATGHPGDASWRHGSRLGFGGIVGSDLASQSQLPRGGFSMRSVTPNLYLVQLVLWRIDKLPTLYREDFNSLIIWSHINTEFISGVWNYRIKWQICHYCLVFFSHDFDDCVHNGILDKNFKLVHYLISRRCRRCRPPSCRA